MRDLEQEINKIIKSAVVVLIGVCIAGICTGLFKARESAAKIQKQTKYIHKINESQSIAFNFLWQEFSKNMSADKIQFKGENPQIVDLLNNTKVNRANLNPDSYLILYGTSSNDFIEDLKNKAFNKFSYKVEFAPVSENSVILYAALYKAFSFSAALDELMAKPFNNGPIVKYFGINWLSDDSLRSGAKVLFYNNENDFAIKLSTNLDDIILYRNSSQKTPNALYKDILYKEKTYKGNKTFEIYDTLSVPFVEPVEQNIYKDIMQKQPDNLDKTTISFAREDFKLKLDNCGINSTCETSKQKEINADTFDRYKRGRDFNFDKNFVLFLKEKGAKEPYYTLFVDTADILCQSL